MTRSEIITLQERVGTVPDGFWGPKSIAACQRHVRRLMPAPSPWPAADERSLGRFYGPPGEESRLVDLDVRDLDVRYLGARVKTVRCHELVATSLGAVLGELAEAAPWLLRQYAGVYVNRPMRGGTRPSLHARGAAIDLDPARNGNTTAWPVRAAMPIEVIEIFARHGWLSAAAFWGRDAMHFQATK